VTFELIQGRRFSFHLKGRAISSILSPISHRLATIQPLPTDRHTDDNPAINAYCVSYKINSNFGPISHRFRDTVGPHALEISIENCGQTAADENIGTIDSL